MIGGKPVASEPRKITPLIKVPFVIITTAAAGAILVCFAVVFLVSPGFQLAAVTIFDAAVYGEIGIASATTVKLVFIVMICMMILNYITKKTRLGRGMIKSAAV